MDRFSNWSKTTTSIENFKLFQVYLPKEKFSQPKTFANVNLLTIGAPQDFFSEKQSSMRRFVKNYPEKRKKI